MFGRNKGNGNGEIRSAVTELQVEQRHTNEKIDRVCGKLTRYADATERRLGKLEEDLGDRPPDDPNAFAQIQSLQGFRERTASWGKTAVGLIVTVVGAVLAAYATGMFD